MIKKLLLCAAFMASAVSYSQTQEDLGKIQLSVSFTEAQTERFEQDVLLKTESKLTQLLADYGIAATNYNNGLLLQPNIIINSQDVVEGGMQNINVITMTLQLVIRQDQTDIIFSSYSKTLKGTGRNTALAISNALNTLSAGDPSLVAFLNKGTDKVLKYYESNCNQIISKSANLDKSGKYAESLALLASIPDAARCYNTAQSKSLEIFSNLQRKECSAFISDAKMFIAQKDYSSAFEVLSRVGSVSPCAAESSLLVKNIENRITAEEKKQWDLQMNMRKDYVALEKQRISAIKDIAVSFYNSQKRPGNVIIVR